MRSQQSQFHVYVSLQDDDRISIFTLDPHSGSMNWREDIPITGGPAPLAIAPDQSVLYVGRRTSQEISTYRINKPTGSLTFVGTTPLQGEPVYVSTDRTGRFVMSAYYYQSTAAVHRVNTDNVPQFPPVEWRYTAHGAHAMLTDPSNRFAYVPHIANRGPNAIFQFRFDEQTGQLTPNTPLRYSPPAYLGPRALAFHPKLDVVYFSDEQGSSVTAYRIGASTGLLTPFQTISTLPVGFTGNNTCSQIRVSTSGRFLFAPNRGHNSIASFIINPSTGSLRSTGRESTEPVPRAFGVAPNDQFLLSAGQQTGRLASYAISQIDGSLTPLETYEVGNNPMWVLIAELT